MASTDSKPVSSSKPKTIRVVMLSRRLGILKLKNQKEMDFLLDRCHMAGLVPEEKIRNNTFGKKAELEVKIITLLKDLDENTIYEAASIKLDGLEPEFGTDE